MRRKTKIENGRVQTFWLGDVHLKALESYRRRHGARSRGDALRRVLDVVAEVEMKNDRKKETEAS